MSVRARTCLEVEHLGQSGKAEVRADDVAACNAAALGEGDEVALPCRCRLGAGTKAFLQAHRQL